MSPRLPLPSSDDLAVLTDLLESGRPLDAFARSQSLAPLTEWQGQAGLLLAGRLAMLWGADQLGRRLHHQAYRKFPTDPLVQFYESSVRWERHGEWAALEFIRHRIGHTSSPPLTHAETSLFGRYAHLLARFRDFTAAEAVLKLTLNAFPEDAWLRVEESSVLEERDDYEAALAANDRALTLRPWYRPAVHQRAHLLQLLNREEEAISLLHTALTKIQSGNTARVLVGIHEDRGELDQIPPLLDLVEKYLPLAEASDLRWLHARRSSLAHLAGNRPEAIRWARENGTFYFKRIAEALEKAGPGTRRVQLPVEFVRQHHMTCAPATLAALTAYWQRPVPHLEIAEAICYDGSLDHAERHWAESQGWIAREFRPTWEITQALLDRGCPFAMVTVEPENAHMQAVIGYDSANGTIIVRDPFLRRLGEWLAPEYLEANAAHGPRALLLVPGDRAELLEGLELPDASLYDATHRFRRHLYFHRLEEAHQAFAELENLAPDHLLTQWSRYDLAFYEARLHDALAAVQAIRAIHPKHNSWRLCELHLIQRLDDPVRHRELLRELGAPRGALIAFRRQYAEELGRDARREVFAERILVSLLRREALSPRNLRAYANLLWSRGDRLRSHHLYRLAACRAEKTEFHWDSYFIASRHLGLAEEALKLLRDRVDRFGHLSTQPVRTLFDALDTLKRTDEALAELAKAQERAPTDGELMLFHADALARVGRLDAASILLDQARPHCHAARWRRAAANLAELRREYPDALAEWQAVTALLPLDTDAHDAVVRLLEITRGKDAAIDYLSTTCEVHPHLIKLRRDLAYRLKNADRLDDALALTASILEHDASDDWTLRERALIFLRKGQTDEALTLAQQALHIAPNAVSSHAVLADILRDRGETALAHAAYRRAVEISIDSEWLFDALVDTAGEAGERRQAIDFLHAELLRQVSLNGVAHNFRSTARGILAVDELSAMLRRYHESRADNWDAWSALIAHLRESGQLDESLQLARQASERFPLLPRVWTDLAEVHAARQERSAQIEHLQKALEINPSWSRAARQLSLAHEQEHRLEEAAAVLRRAVRFEPTEAMNHGFLADVLWRLGQSDEAVTTIETALDLNPNYGWAWSQLESWSATRNEPDRAKNLAKRFTETRSGRVAVWLQYVQRAINEPDPQPLLTALDRAAALDPRNANVWDLRARLLSRHRRYDEAKAACFPAVFGDDPPFNLRGRAAWVDWERGQQTAAIKALREVLATNPDYLWGWSVLTEWAWADKDWKTIEEAAERWAWLDPENAIAVGYQAAAHQHAGRTEARVAALVRAIHLDPQYDYALDELFTHYLAQKKVNDAEALLVHYDTHYPRADGLLARLRIAQHCRERPAVRRLLKELALAGSQAKRRFNQGVGLLLDARQPDQIETALADLLDDPQASETTASHWVTARLRQQKLWTTLWKVSRARYSADRTIQLLEATANALGDEKSSYPLRIFRWCNRRRLRASNQTWGAVLYALSKCSLHPMVVQWARDWAQRAPAPEPWMLFNLVLSMQEFGRHKDATAALDCALAQPPDHTYEKLLAWRAHEHLLQGQTQPAIALLEQVNSSGWTTFLRSIEFLAHMLRDVQTAPAEQRAAQRREALQKLRLYALKNPSLVDDRCLRRAYRRTLRRIEKDSGRAWSRWRFVLPLRWSNPDPAIAKKWAFAIAFSGLCYWIFAHSRLFQ